MSRDLAGIEPGSQRDQMAAAVEAVALVLDEDSPLPESAADVEELARRLRGHISRLGVMVSPGETALCHAQQLGSAGVPDGYMPSRVYLVRLAEATQELVVAVQAAGASPAKPRLRSRWRMSRINLLRGVVFVIAFACLVLAASVPRT
ncbi:DUF6415 family natural product biosynthesis protein [Streptomyces sp. NPDC002523]